MIRIMGGLARLPSHCCLRIILFTDRPLAEYGNIYAIKFFVNLHAILRQSIFKVNEGEEPFFF
jgi:hypothetical protein